MATAAPRAALSREPSNSRPLTMAREWDSRYRLPVQPAVVSTIRASLSPRAGSHGPVLPPGSATDERLARMMVALDEHERRDPRSRQARLDATFFASLRLMLREALAAKGEVQTQHITQLEQWFESSRPRPHANGDADARGSRVDSAHTRAPSALEGSMPAQVNSRDSLHASPAERRAAGASRLASVAKYTPFDVPAELQAFKRRDLYSTFAARHLLAPADALLPAGRRVPGSERESEAVPSPFAHYRLSEDPGVAAKELEMDESWVARRRGEASHAADEEQMGHVVERWAVSRARVDEEIARRREASTHSAQTGMAFRAPARRAGSGASAGCSSDSDDDGDDGNAAGGPRARTSVTATASTGGTHPRVLFAERYSTIEREVAGGLGGIRLTPHSEAQSARPTTAHELFRAGAAARTAFPLEPSHPPPRPLPADGKAKQPARPGASVAKRDSSLHPSGARTHRPLSAPSAMRIMQLQVRRAGAAHHPSAAAARGSAYRHARRASASALSAPPSRGCRRAGV